MTDRIVIQGERRTLYLGLLGTCAQLTDDELRVVDRVAKALHAGQSVYGGLDIQTDSRDFAEEARQEAVDGLVYTAIAAIRRAS